jgi:hypothetical protein
MNISLIGVLKKDNQLTKYSLYLYPNMSTISDHFACRKFMESTIMLARAMLPDGQWGYYHYPYCYNYKPGQSHCDLKIREENDQ